MPTPQETARLEQIKKTWQQKRQITTRLDKIKTKLAEIKCLNKCVFIELD